MIYNITLRRVPGLDSVMYTGVIIIFNEKLFIQVVALLMLTSAKSEGKITRSRFIRLLSERISRQKWGQIRWNFGCM